MEVRNWWHAQLPATYPNSSWSLNLLTFSLGRPFATKLLLFPLGLKVICEPEIEIFFPLQYLFAGRVFWMLRREYYSIAIPCWKKKVNYHYTSCWAGGGRRSKSQLSDYLGQCLPLMGVNGWCKQSNAVSLCSLCCIYSHDEFGLFILLLQLRQCVVFQPLHQQQHSSDQWRDCHAREPHRPLLEEQSAGGTPGTPVYHKDRIGPLVPYLGMGYVSVVLNWNEPGQSGLSQMMLGVQGLGQAGLPF